MDAKKGKYEIELTHDECYQIACSMARGLKDAVKTHWVNHPTADWKKSESMELSLMKQFFNLSLFPHVFESTIRELDQIMSESKVNQN